MNPDKLTHFNAAELRQPAFAALDALQSANPAIQLLAAATLVCAMSDALGVNPHEVMQRIERAKRHIDAPFTSQYQAIVAYAKGELRG